MKKLLISALLMTATATSASNLLQIPVLDINGKVRRLSEFEGKALLIVNVASKCGFTSQYTGLEALYRSYKDKGLVVLGFPCNQFFGQEPGSNSDILTFCRKNYGVTFPMFSKIDVKGNGQHPLFAALTGPDSPLPGKVSWNFNKFLINREGRLVARFGSTTKPQSGDLTKAIEEALR